MFKVCIDPGHNETGADRGARYKDLAEEILTLKIAKLVKQGLEAQGNFTVIMTREGQTVNGPATTLLDSLRTRCSIANNAGADLLVSIHINAGKGTGSEVLVYGTGGKAEVCGKIMAPLIADAGSWTNRGVKVQNIQVLRDTTMPAILTENGFIDNDNDYQKLLKDSVLKDIADAHVLGICNYFGVKYKTSPTVQPVATTSQAAALPFLIIYSGEVESRIMPYLQESLKAPAIPLAALSETVVNAAQKLIGIGGKAEDYVVAGKKLTLYKLIAGSNRIETAEAVIKAVRGGIA
ncbi:cell wall hydrolase/autolysin [Syntrophobotulus glycolicus DSM 8271]|uniref:Cell wall hydrolase/autolysin n=1 Tax=Syntrophobotulus glycolicus (strain DSM 8271 / FlGlyR) TaxID=645991 RepID=F0T0P8_SYNGF|nr:N-acetylmuramoyl-L-alanine amidase [Syntrophobotulus glycolicus]ADY55113.1 cell wall hydrolase/autolysin [Syntrophobotulus glycolicus DSM 8271]